LNSLKHFDLIAGANSPLIEHEYLRSGPDPTFNQPWVRVIKLY